MYQAVVNESLKGPYPQLKRRIREIYGKQAAFARALGLSERSLSLKLSGKRDFRMREMEKSMDLLCITGEELGSYFFEQKVQ